mmetsp:Transcript_61174/g.68505  ORF Transcript_61174/g.68505 Transcript_61174/m.68505 type:complete len:238 (-) Transcript_61174:215-928(-)
MFINHSVSCCICICLCLCMCLCISFFLLFLYQQQLLWFRQFPFLLFCCCLFFFLCLYLFFLVLFYLIWNLLLLFRIDVFLVVAIVVTTTTTTLFCRTRRFGILSIVLFRIIFFGRTGRGQFFFFRRRRCSIIHTIFFGSLQWVLRELNSCRTTTITFLIRMFVIVITVFVDDSFCVIFIPMRKMIMLLLLLMVAKLMLMYVMIMILIIAYATTHSHLIIDRYGKDMIDIKKDQNSHQ